nr:hypothetical protein [uncultured Halomonas sp.]
MSGRSIEEISRFFSTRDLDAGYLAPELEGNKISVDDQFVDYMRRVGLHDYASYAKGAQGVVTVTTWFVHLDGLKQTESVLYRSDTASGDPQIFINALGNYAVAGNVLAILAHEGQIYLVNASCDELLDSAHDTSSPLSRLMKMMVSTQNKPLDDRFSEWNLRLLRSFFSEASEGEEVFLRVDKDFLDQVGQDIGGDSGFLEAVRKGPDWIVSQESFTCSILKLKKQRKNPSRSYKDPGNFDIKYRGLRAPAYLPYLAALVRNDAENATSYYDRLAKDLKLKHQFNSHEMGQVEKVWDDLEEWTRKNNGRFGFFKRRILGGYRLIGVPRSQSILKPSDMENLAQVFAQAQVRPGQELSEESLTQILNETRASGSIFTAGFQRALEIDDFVQPIRAAIFNAYSDWDGTLPIRGGGATGVESSTNGRNEGEIYMGISLLVIRDFPLQLSPSWRVPAIQDIGKFELERDGLIWSGQFSGTEGANTARAHNQEADFWDVAKRASDTTVQFDARCFVSEDSEPTMLKLTLMRRILWVLTPAIDNLTGDIELREGDLPASGSAFLMAPPRSVQALQGYIEREKPECEVISALGVPKDWLIVRLVDCASLSEEQRILPDGEKGARPRPRAIRFVGGKSIRRGYSRMYLPYDLPFIELDAPLGARVDCSGGIEVEEQSSPLSVNAADHVDWRPLRRFKFRLPHSRSASYELKAISANGSSLGQAKLRVADLGGDVVDTGKPFSLDNIGRHIHSYEGLSGVVLGTARDKSTETPSELNDYALTDVELGSSVGCQNLKVGIHEMFLDALAQSGSLDYGVARDLLQRLLLSTGELDEPVLLLLELRRRGYLGVSTTYKGHIARIHAIKPTLYSLPLTFAGRPIWAVAGTLRIDHWKIIARKTEAWSAHQLNSNRGVFEPWRLVISDRSVALETCSQIGFRFSEKPCISVASWSASLGLFRDETFRNTMESIGSAREGAMRLNASTGRFTAIPRGDVCELWRVRDLDIGVGNLYVLADQGKYAFVNDSRWGVWLALDAFAKHISLYPEMDGVHPLPITYESARRTIWLPARISLPTVLERALVLCSGDSPDVLTLQKDITENTNSRLLLIRKKDGLPEFSANRFYTDMADGKWLAYRYVPENIARIIAGKLGAVLDAI